MCDYGVEGLGLAGAGFFGARGFDGGVERGYGVEVGEEGFEDGEDVGLEIGEQGEAARVRGRVEGFGLVGEALGDVFGVEAVAVEA